MLRSMADPFELNVTSLSVPIREKAKEQSPPALLFCISINHFSAAMPRAQRRAFPIVFYFAASNSASISAEGAGVSRLTTTHTTREVRKAGSSS